MARPRPRPPSATAVGAPAARVTGPGVVVAAAFAVLLPLAVNPWGFQQRLPVAWWLVLVAVPLGFALTVRTAGGVMVARAQRWWLVLLAVLLAATVVSVAPLNALIGSPARRLGLIGWTALALACWWGVQLGRDRRVVDVVGRALVVGSLPVSLIGLVERGERFFSFGDGLNLVRSASTLRNAAFLGAYLALVLPVAVRLALAGDTDRRWRGVGAVAAALAAITLVFSQTRAAWLGAVAGLAVLAVAELRARGRGDARLRRGIGAVAVVAIALLAVAPVRDRALSVTVLGQGSTRARTLLWLRALPTIADRPLLGYGPDATVVAYPRHLDARFEREVTRQTLPDRAHTLLLDLGIWAGVPGVLAGAALLIAVARRARPADAGSLGWGIAAGLIAYGVQLGFSFPLADLDALVWLLAGLLLAPAATRIALPAGFTRGVVGCGLAAAVAGGVWQGRDVLADRRLRVGVEADARGDVVGAERAFRAATRLAPERAQYWQAYGRFERFVGEAAGDPARLQTSADAHRRALELVPGDTSYGLDVLDAELSAAERGAGDAASVVAGLTELLTRDPHSARAWFTLGVAQADAGRLDDAASSWTTAASLAEWASGPPRNLARLADQRGDTAGARLAYERVLAIEGTDAEAAAWLGAHPA